MKVGAARLDVTPDYAVDLTGFASRTNPAEGVLEPISARAAVFDNGGLRLAVVSLDVLELPRAKAEALRRAVAEGVGTSRDCVGVFCTHTHSAPACYPLLECGEVSARFAAELHERAVAAAVAAVARLEPVSLHRGESPLHLGLNRRHADDGPADDALRCLVATAASGRAALVMMHHACHPVCLWGANRAISGDYPGAGCRAVERRLGGDAVALFLNGCAGDINPRSEYFGEDGVAAAGELLADAAATCLPAAAEGAPAASTELAATYRTVDLPYAATPAAAMPAALQHLRLGPVELLALSGEVFFEIGRGIREQAGRPGLWVAAYANGGHGYISTRAAQSEGGYEPDSSNYYYGRPPLREGAAELLVEAGASLCRAG